MLHSIPTADAAAGERLKRALAEEHCEVLGQKRFAFAAIQKKNKIWVFPVQLLSTLSQAAV